MIHSKKFRLSLMGFTAAVALAGCFGADKVASPGEGVLVGGGSGSSSSSSSGSSSSGAADNCPTGFSNVGVVAGLRNCQLPNRIAGNLVLAKLPGVIYSISGRVAVGDDQGANPAAPITGTEKGILTIAPGVKVFGSSGLDYIVVQRGSQIFAEGTAADPIIFTSRQSVLGETNVESDGQWGGLVIAGRAPTNVCPGTVTPPNIACDGGQIEGTNAFYGGNSVADNSGVLKYVRVMHSGFEVLPGNELNGITFAGVGNGTTLEYIQVHNSSDDGVEFFGGAANVKHLVLTGISDDALDTDTGYRGNIQFLIVKGSTARGDRLFEMSCAGNKSYCSHPVVSNATIIRRSSIASNGLEINTDTDLTLVNSVIYNTGPTSTFGIRIAGSGTELASPNFQSVYMGGFTTAFSSPATTTIFGLGANNTASGASTLADFVNGANETAVTVFPFTTLNSTTNGGSINGVANGNFFTPVTYIGAVRDSADTWYAGWTCGLVAGSTC